MLFLVLGIGFIQTLLADDEVLIAILIVYFDDYTLLVLGTLELTIECIRNEYDFVASYGV